MRVCPWEEPRLCGGAKRSNPMTFRPRRAQWKDAELPTGVAYEDVGLCFSTNSGPFETIKAFDRLVREEHHVNPVMFSMRHSARQPAISVRH